MRSLLILSAILVGVFVADQSSGQTNVSAIPEQPGVILVRVNSSLDSAVGAVFYTTRSAGDPTFSHTDINQSVLSGDSAIRRLLGLPNAFHGLQLRPFIPTHSVAFEDIRERSNPQLFQIGDIVQTPNQSGNLAALRASENNISHWFILSYSDSISGDRAAALAKKSALVQLAEPQ
jgi:hypothetical protein